MLDGLRTALATCLYFTGCIALARILVQQQGPRLMILNYHTSGEKALARQWLYLRRHYRILPLEQALEKLFSPSSLSSQDTRPLLAITFDDGYYDNFTDAFALARKLEIPLTIFLVPGYIASGRRFWWLEPDFLVSHSPLPAVDLEGQVFHLTLPAEQKVLAGLIDARLRLASSVQERETCLAEFRQLLAVPDTTIQAENQLLPMSWDEIAAMRSSEWISFGSHTMHHPILSRLSDPAEIEYEITVARSILEKHLGLSVSSFAYPLGKPEDITEQGISSVQKAGYRWAVTTVNGWNTSQTNPLFLHRLTVDANQHWFLVAAMVSDVRHLLPNLFQVLMASLRQRKRNI